MENTADWLLGRTFLVPEYKDARFPGDQLVTKEHLVTVTGVGEKDWTDLRVYVHTDGATQRWHRGEFYQRLCEGFVDVYAPPSVRDREARR